MAKRVAVLDPDGNFATIDDTDIPNLPDGARVLSATEVKNRELREAYDQKSTAEKIGGAVAGLAAGPVVGSALGSTGVITESPEMEAYQRGAKNTLTMGFDEGAIRRGLDAAGPAGSGARYAQRLDDVTETSPTAHTVGEVAGFAALSLGGRAPGAARALPGMGIMSAGSIAEAGAGKLLGGLAKRGVIGRALAEGGKLAARGAVEAGLYTAGTEIANEDLHNRELTGEKLYTIAGHSGLSALMGGAIGGGFGATGSLAKSGGGALISKLADGSLGGSGRKAADALAFDSLGTTRKIADKVNAEVKGGTGAVGAYVNDLRKAQSVADVARTSRADEVLPLIQQDKARLGNEIGDVVKAHNIRVHVDEVVKPAVDVMDAMRRDPTRIQGAEAFGKRIQLMGEALHNDGKIAADGTMNLADAYYARAQMEAVAHELGPKSAAQNGFREYLRALDSHLVSRVEAAASLAGEDAGRLRALKRQYHLASWAEKAAEDGTNRIAGNNIFGLREAMIGGSAIGGALVSDDPVGGALKGVGLAMGGRLLRQRGAAVAAKALSKTLDSGFIANALRSADDAVAKAVPGVIFEAKAARAATGASKPSAASAGAAKAEQGALRDEATAIVKWTGDMHANPQRTLATLTEAASEVGRVAGPRAAAGYTQATLQAMQYVNRYVPQKERRDPLDPRSVPPLTMDEAQSLTRAYRYASKPQTVWQDFAKGIVTPEGLDAAQSLMPEQFANFQVMLFDHVQQHMMRNKQLTQSQRLRIDKLLGGAAIRPDDIARNQQNFAKAPAEADQGPKPEATGGNAPVNLNIQQSGFDAVEQRATAG